MRLFSTFPQKAIDVGFYFEDTSAILQMDNSENIVTDDEDSEEEPINNVQLLWESIQQKTYDHVDPILHDILQMEKPKLKHEVLLQEKLKKFPEGVLREYLVATYVKCKFLNQLSEQQKKVKAVVDEFFYYYLLEKAVFGGIDSGDYYDVHEIKTDLDYKIFACSPPFKSEGRIKIFSKFIYYNVSIIVDLTNENDHKRLLQDNDSFKYWASTVNYDKASSVFAKMKSKPEVSNLQLGTKKITRINFPWQDAEGTDPEELYAFIEGLSQLKGDRLVHCFAGKGRTGTYITCEKLFQAAQNKKHLFWSSQMQTISDYITGDRKIRGPSYVQNLKQFFTICGFVNILLAKGCPVNKEGDV